MSVIESTAELSAQEIKEVFGQLDENIKKIEKALFVNITSRDSKITVVGDETNAVRAKHIIEEDISNTAVNNIHKIFIVIFFFIV